jgi:hypothetical protein
MSAQVIGLIYYEALKLHLRGVPYHRPGPDHRPIGHDASLVSSAHRSSSHDQAGPEAASEGPCEVNNRVT